MREYARGEDQISTELFSWVYIITWSAWGRQSERGQVESCQFIRCKKKKILETTVHSRTMQETLVGTTENNSLLSALFGPQWECRLVLNLILLDELELL